MYDQYIRGNKWVKTQIDLITLQTRLHCTCYSINSACIHATNCMNCQGLSCILYIC